MEVENEFLTFLNIENKINRNKLLKKNIFRKINKNLLSLERMKDILLSKYQNRILFNKENNSENLKKKKIPFIKIKGEIKTIQEILTNLKDTLRTTEDEFLKENFNNIPKIFKNQNNLPDGSALYGILFHVENPAVDGFNNLENNNKSKNINIENIIIRDLTHKTKETVSLQLDNEKKTENFKKAQIDPRGSTFDILNYTNKKGAYISNPVGDAQLIVSKYKNCLSKKSKDFYKLNLYHSITKRDSISPKILKWASLKNPKRLKNKYICNADQMLHAIKGLIPLRLSGVNNVYLKNIKIENIKNLSDFGSKICGNYNFKTSFKNSKNGFFGADIRGVTVENCSYVNFRNFSLENFESKSGNVIGLDIMFKSKEISGIVTTNNLVTIDSKNLPNDFIDIPQSHPSVYPVLIFKDSSSSILIKNIPEEFNKITT